MKKQNDFIGQTLKADLICVILLNQCNRCLKKPKIMKKLTAISIFILLTIFAVAQEAPKNANLIQIKTSNKIDDAFKKIGRILINEGYELEIADEVFNMITTMVTEKKYGFMGTYYSSRILNSLTGMLDQVLSPILPENWKYISFIVAKK